MLPCTTMLTPFMEIPQREDALPLTTIRPPWPLRPDIGWRHLRSMILPDIMFSPVPGPCRSMHVDRCLLVHAATVIAGGAFDVHLDRGVQTHGNRMAAFGGCYDFPNRLVGVIALGRVCRTVLFSARRPCASRSKLCIRRLSLALLGPTLWLQK